MKGNVQFVINTLFALAILFLAFAVRYDSKNIQALFKLVESLGLKGQKDHDSK